MNDVEILKNLVAEYDAQREENKTTNIALVIDNKDINAIENLIKRVKELEEKYKRLSIEAQATAFDDDNQNTECLMRVLLKQGEIILDEKGYYQRRDFDWEENLMKMGLCKKREKTFIVSDDDCLDEYTKQLESQLKEYQELKKMFKKYYVVGNETMYDGCIKMQDEIDNYKEIEEEHRKENGKLREKIKELEDGLKWRISYCNELEEDLFQNSSNYVIPKSKIKEILGIEEQDKIDILDYLEIIVDEFNRLEDIEDKKVQIEYKKVFNKGVKSIKDKIKEKIEELENMFDKEHYNSEYNKQFIVDCVAILEELLEE